MAVDDPFGPARKPLTIEAALSKLRMVSGGDGAWYAACPTHDDSNPSMSVSVSADGRLLAFCHRCCTEMDDEERSGWYGTVMAILTGGTAVELESRRYARKPRTDTRVFKFDRAHVYYDARHHPVYRKVINKTADGAKRPIWYRNVNGPESGLQPAWVASIGTADPGLYLGWVLPAEGPVVIVEGEKDAETLARLGHIVVSPPHGAGTWRDTWTDVLAGREVRIIADADDSGRKHARRVAAKLTAAGCAVSTWEPLEPHSDVTDAVEAGLSVPGCLRPLQTLVEADEDEADVAGRRMRLTTAAEYKIRRVHWAWEGRLAIGSLGLLGGREGLGKSAVSYWIAARVSRGELPGEFYGTPKGVLICATEDSWEHTVVPRLVAAGADLTKIYRVEMVADDDIELGLSLPRDLLATERAARQVDAALMILDPLMSRLAADLDTHRDADVRRALEPLAQMADRTGMAVLGLIHVNKSGSADPVTSLMGSRAFAAVARSVTVVVPDPNDEAERRRLLGTPKNNLGRVDLPLIPFTVEPYAIETEDDGTAWTGLVVWQDEIVGTIAEAMSDAASDPDARSLVAECMDAIRRYMEQHNGVVLASDGRKFAASQDYKTSTVTKAIKRLRIESKPIPGVAGGARTWRLPSSGDVAVPPSGVAQGHVAPRGDTNNATTQQHPGQSVVAEQQTNESCCPVALSEAPRTGAHADSPRQLDHDGAGVAPRHGPPAANADELARNAALDALAFECEVCGLVRSPETWVGKHYRPFWVVRCREHHPWSINPTEAS